MERSSWKNVYSFPWVKATAQFNITFCKELFALQNYRIRQFLASLQRDLQGLAKPVCSQSKLIVQAFQRFPNYSRTKTNTTFLGPYSERAQNSGPNPQFDSSGNTFKQSKMNKHFDQKRRSTCSVQTNFFGVSKINSLLLNKNRHRISNSIFEKSKKFWF